jgi:hypothetical protein
MLSTFEGGGIERFDDLCVDESDGVWRPRQLWIGGAGAASRHRLLSQTNGFRGQPIFSHQVLAAGSESSLIRARNR